MLYDLKWYADIAQGLRDIYWQGLNRATDEGRWINWFHHVREGGKTFEWVREQIRLSPEYVALHTTPAFQPAPRFWKGNMCGVRVPGVPAVNGGARDASLVLSWFYDRYSDDWRWAIRHVWRTRGITHVVLSWPDARSNGTSLDQFKAICQELIADGFYPCVFLSSKDHDRADVPTILAYLEPVLDALVGIVPMFCIGWELSLWLSPTQVQQLIDAIAPRILQQQPETRLYVHFQEGYPSFQQPGKTVADFWNPNVGKLTGLLYQKILSQTDAQFRDSLKDCLERFGGGFGMVKGFDFVALELTAMQQFNGTCSEAEGDRIGQLAIDAPKVNGVGVMGSGNGFRR